eukprot:5573470-Pleurochrysis_carterae.AAC.2
MRHGVRFRGLFTVSVRGADERGAAGVRAAEAGREAAARSRRAAAAHRLSKGQDVRSATQVSRLPPRLARHRPLASLPTSPSQRIAVSTTVVGRIGHARERHGCLRSPCRALAAPWLGRASRCCRPAAVVP